VTTTAKRAGNFEGHGFFLDPLMGAEGEAMGIGFTVEDHTKVGHTAFSGYIGENGSQVADETLVFGLRCEEVAFDGFGSEAVEVGGFDEPDDAGNEDDVEI
jgi:hypothetical protein